MSCINPICSSPRSLPALEVINRLTQATPELRTEHQDIREQLKTRFMETCSGAFDFFYALEALNLSTDDFRFGLEYLRDNESFSFFPIHQSEVCEVSR